MQGAEEATRDDLWECRVLQQGLVNCVNKEIKKNGESVTTEAAVDETIRNVLSH